MFTASLHAAPPAVVVHARKPGRYRLVVSTLAIAFVAVVLAVSVGYALLLWLWSSRQPSIDVNYASIVNDEIKKVPEESWAWPKVRKTFLEIKWPESSFWSRTRSDEPNTRWFNVEHADPQWAEVRDFVRENQRSFDELREALELPELGVLWTAESDDDNATSNLPSSAVTRSDHMLPSPPGNPPLLLRSEQHAQPFRTIARLFRARCTLAIMDGEIDLAIDSIEAQFHIARLLSQHPSVLQWLVSLGAERLACESCIDLIRLSGSKLTEAQLQRCVRLFRDFPLPRSFEDIRASEDMLYKDTMQRVFAGGANGSGRITRAGVDWLLTREAELNDPPTSVSTWKRLHAYVSSVADVSNRKFQDWHHANLTAASQALFSQHPWEVHRDDDAVGEWKGWREPTERHELRCRPTTTLQFNEVSAWWIMHDVRTVRQVAEVVIPLEQFRRTAGDWPKRLQDLPLSNSTKLPRDPFDGKTIRYRVTPQGPLCYSIGNDRNDGGGVPPSKGRASAWTWINSNLVASDDAVDGDWVICAPAKGNTTRRGSSDSSPSGTHSQPE